MAGSGTITLLGFREMATVITSYTQRVPVAVDAAAKVVAMEFQREVVKMFRTQGDGQWKPLNPITIALRKGGGAIGRSSSGGTKPLVKTGSMRKSVTTQRKGYAAYSVGVHRRAGKASGGAKMVNVAMIQETGLAIIPITKKMRSFFRWLYWKGVIPFPWPSPKNKYIVIPRRSFIGDAFRKFAPTARARYAAAFKAQMGGKVAVKKVGK